MMADCYTCAHPDADCTCGPNGDKPCSLTEDGCVNIERAIETAKPGACSEQWQQEVLNNGAITLFVLLMVLVLPLFPMSHHLCSRRTGVSLGVLCSGLLVTILLVVTSEGNKPRELGPPGCVSPIRNETNSASLVVVTIAMAVVVAYQVYQRRVLLQRRDMLEGPLIERFSDESIRLISVAWLLSQPAGFVLKRRQEMPDAAFVPAAEAVALFHAGKVAVLSYRWLTALDPAGKHADPTGWHVAAVCDFFRREGGGQRGCQAVFIDYSSCWQIERSEAEQEAFGKAISVMTRLYASPMTVVIQQKSLPLRDHPELRAAGTYNESGWCTMEQAAASLATESGGTLFELGKGWVQIRRGQRDSPEVMHRIFHDEALTRFTSRADREFVSSMYAELHALVLQFDERTMPPLTRFLDSYVYHDPKRAVAWAGVVALAGLAFFAVQTSQSVAERGTVTLGRLFFAVDVVLLFVLVLCLPSRRVRGMIADRCHRKGERPHAKVAPRQEVPAL